MIANGTYKNREGEEKTSWEEVGVIMLSQAGKEFVLLDPTVNLAGFEREPGKDRIIASIFEDKPKQQQAPQQQYQQQPQYGQTTNGAPIVVEDASIPF